jgi:hypothetical protein
MVVYTRATFNCMPLVTTCATPKMKEPTALLAITGITKNSNEKSNVSQEGIYL